MDNIKISVIKKILLIFFCIFCICCCRSAEIQPEPDKKECTEFYIRGQSIIKKNADADFVISDEKPVTARLRPAVKIYPGVKIGGDSEK